MELIVISGGQTGADQAGLSAAKDVGFKTGGWLPRNSMTLDGPRPEFLELYGMKETPYDGYGKRTEWNVQDSDATIRFATNWESPGELLTRRCIDKYHKPKFDVSLNTSLDMQNALIKFIVIGNYKTINIAGNSEKTSPGIYRLVYNYLCYVFTTIKMQYE